VLKSPWCTPCKAASQISIISEPVFWMCHPVNRNICGPAAHHLAICSLVESVVLAALRPASCHLKRSMGMRGTCMLNWQVYRPCHELGLCPWPRRVALFSTSKLCLDDIQDLSVRAAEVAASEDSSMNAADAMKQVRTAATRFASSLQQ
jgi:hypothetical protein